jgi:alkylhydroperoxidase/carboxymuconolactone decarboxylase family protein YurZ
MVVGRPILVNDGGRKPLEALMIAKLPSKAAEVEKQFPALWGAYSALGKACTEAGPLTGDTVRLIKLALAIGAASEGAVHSHTRRALDEGISREALRQVALLAVPTLGFPRAVAALSWIDDVSR